MADANFRNLGNKCRRHISSTLDRDWWGGWGEKKNCTAMNWTWRSLCLNHRRLWTLGKGENPGCKKKKKLLFWGGLEGSGLPITRTASANQNVTKSYSSQIKTQTVATFWPISMATKVKTQWNTVKPVKIANGARSLITRDINCNQKKENTIIRTLESNSKHRAFAGQHRNVVRVVRSKACETVTMWARLRAKGGTLCGRMRKSA